MAEICTVSCYCLLCLKTIDVCIWCMCVFMSVVVIVCESVGMFVV